MVTKKAWAEADRLVAGYSGEPPRELLKELRSIADRAAGAESRGRRP